MPVDRKALMKRMKEAKANQRERSKHILYPLPDLRGPGGNAYALLGQAQSLMKKAGLPETLYDEFNAEATSGDYDHLLDTIKQWFTLAVQDSAYVPVPDDFDIKTLVRGNDDGIESWEDLEEALKVEGGDAILAEAEATDEEVRRVAEIQDRINREIRAELGLGDDEVVIVQIKKAKK